MKRLSDIDVVCWAAALLLAAVMFMGCGNKKGSATGKTNNTTTVATADSNKAAVPAAVKDSAAEKAVQAVTDKQKLVPVKMSLWGNVGDTSFLFDMNGTEGSYIPFDMEKDKVYGARRQLKLMSYNPKDGKCVINAYLKGDYIGQFDGVLTEDKIDLGGGDSKFVQSYCGFFTSAKGARLKFDLYYD